MADILLSKISDALASADSVEALTRPLLTLLELVTGFESSYLTRIDQAEGVQRILYARNSKAMQIPEGLAVPWGDTLCKRALDEGRFFTDDVPDCWGDSDAAQALGIHTYISMPVYLPEGALFGTLCAASADKRPISDTGQQILGLFTTLIAQAIERENLLAQLRKTNEELALHSSRDALTGLPNRRALVADMTRMFAIAQRSGKQVQVLFIDLDGFKQINDTHGHDAGDEFLIQVGRRISVGLRAGDEVSRFGGDEFVVVGISTEAAPPALALEAMRDRVAALIRGEFNLSRCSFHYPGASIGAVTVDPTSSSPDVALRQADAAMYAIKKQRRATQI